MLRESTLLIARALLLAFTAAMWAGVCLTTVEICVASIAILRVNNSSGSQRYDPAACSRKCQDQVKLGTADRTARPLGWHVGSPTVYQGRFPLLACMQPLC